MPPENNQNQFSLESQRDNIRFQEILENLDVTLTRLDETQRSLSTGAKLDDLMEILVSKYGEDRAKINWEFNNSAQDISFGNQQHMNEAMRADYEDIARLQQQKQMLEASIARYENPEFVTPSEQTVMADAFAAGQMRNRTQQFLDTGYYQPISAGYFGSDIQQPYFKNNLSIIGLSGGANLSPFESQLSEQFHMQELSQSQDPSDIRTFLDYQRTMYGESQKAMYNKHISSALGMDGMISRGDFEGIASPAISGLAEDLGVAVDEAAGIIKKLKDLRVIAQDVDSGSGVEILNAVDNTANILASVSKLIGSNDISQLIATSNQLASIGGGSFTQGLDIVKNDTASIIGPFSDPQYSITHAAAMGEHYASTFGGLNKSSVNMGAWDFKTRNLLNQYATNDFFNYAGGPEQAAQVFMPHLAKRATGVQALIRSKGEGYDLLGGAESLSGSASDDPVKFYMNLTRDIKKASEDMSGTRAKTYLEKEVRKYQSDYGFSEDESLLAVFGGDPTAVDAYKEIRSAEDAFATEYEDKVHSARFASIFQPRKGFSISRTSGVSELNTSGEVLEDVGSSRFNQLLIDGFDDTISDLSGVYKYDEGSMASYTGLQDIKTVSRGVGPEDAAMRSTLEKKDVGALAHIPAILATDKATEATNAVVARIASMKGSFEFKDIKFILTQGLQEYVYSGMVGTDNAQRLGNYIAELTPYKALSQIGPMVDKSSAFYKLLNIGVDPSKSSQLLSSTEEYARANLAGTLREAGMSVDKIEGLIGSPSDSNAMAMSDLINNNLITSSIVGGAAGTAIVGGAIAAGVLTAGWAPLAYVAASIIAPEALSATIRAGSGGIDYLQTTIGDRIDMEDVVSELGDGTVSTLQSEIRYMLSFTRAFASYLMFNNDDNITTLLSYAVSIYAQTYSEYLSSRSDDIKPEKRPVLPDNMLEAAIRLLASKIDASSKDSSNDNISKLDWARGVLRLINKKTSEVGKSLREGNPIQKSVTMRRTIESEADEISTGMFAGLTDQGSLINLFNQREAVENFAEVGTALTSQTRDSAAVEEQFREINEVVGRKAETEKGATASRNVISKIRSAIENKDYSALQDIDDSDLILAEKALGKDFVGEVRDIMADSDTNSQRRRLSQLMVSKGNEASSIVEQDAMDGRKAVNMFMELTRRMEIDTNMQQRVMQIGKLLNGDTL